MENKQSIKDKITRKIDSKHNFVAMNPDDLAEILTDMNNKLIDDENELIITSLDKLDNVSNWSLKSGTGVASINTSDTIVTPILELSATTISTKSIYRRDIYVALYKGSAISIRLKRDVNLQTIDINLRCGSNTYTNVFSTNQSVSVIPVGEWFDLIIPISNFNLPANATVDMLVRLKALEIHITPTVGQTTVVSIAKVDIVKSTSIPSVIFQFDDARTTTYTTAYPVLQANNYSGAIPVEYNMVGTVNRMSLLQLQEVYNLGWEINGHHTAQMGAMDETTATGIFTAAKDFMLDNAFYRGASHWVWPGGSRSVAVDKIASKFYRTRRPVGSMYNISIKGIYNPYDISVYYIVKTTTLAQTKAVVDKIKEYGGTLIFVFHDIVPNGNLSANEDWEIGNFKALVEYCKLQGIQGTNYDQMFGSDYKY